MNHSYRFSLLIVASIVCAWGNYVTGQPVPAPAVAPAPAVTLLPAPATTIREATTIDAAQAKDIRAFIDDSVARLADPDGDVLAKARSALCEASKNGLKPPSAMYGLEYANALNDALLAFLAKNKEVRGTLNAAIVAARVAQDCANAKLVPVVAKLLDDKCEAINLWGMRAARYVLADSIKAGTHKQLLASVMAVAGRYIIPPVAAADRPSVGPAIITEAVKALTQSIDKAVVQVVADPLLSLAQKRMTLYGNKNTIPDEAQGESDPVKFLSRAAVWAGLTPQQQKSTRQLIADLLVLLADRYDDKIPNHREDLLEYAHVAIQVTAVIAQVSSDKNLETVALKADQDTRTALAGSLAEALKPLRDAISSSWKDVTVHLPGWIP